jgi:hypothetical protein
MMWVVHDGSSPDLDARHSGAVWQPAGVDKKVSAQIDGIDKKLTAQLEALRAEMRQGFSELRLDFHTEISELTRRVERLEEQRGLVRP